MTAYPSPDPRNYAIFKGIAHFTPEGGVRTDLGNVSGFSLTPEVEKLPHFSSRTGIRTKDREVVVEKVNTITMILEEMTPLTFQIALLGTPGEDTDGNQTIVVDDTDLIRGILEFDGTNEVGPKWSFNFPAVALSPSGAVELISEEWAAIEVTGDITATNGVFYTATLQDSATT